MKTRKIINNYDNADVADKYVKTEESRCIKYIKKC